MAGQTGQAVIPIPVQVAIVVAAHITLMTVADGWVMGVYAAVIWAVAALAGAIFITGSWSLRR